MLNIYFYGKGDSPGHHFYTSCMTMPTPKPGMSGREPELRGMTFINKPQIPWGWEIDGKMQPQGIPGDSQPLGVACLHHKNGWTMLSFWDRSGDPRPNSNGNFIVQGTLDFEMMWSLALEFFPDLMARIGPLKLQT